MTDQYENTVQLYLKAIKEQNWHDVAFYATEILKKDDGQGHVWANRALALQKIGHPLDAILNYKKSLEFDETAITYSNLGCAYFEMGKNELAKSVLTKAIAIEPLAQSYLTLGNVKKMEGDMKGALRDYEKVIETDPNYADGHLVYGMALLKSGQLKEGWEHYEWRWKTDQLPERKLKCPRWNGEDLTGKSILVYGEQGLGDIIQFSRYTRILAKQFPKAKVIVEARYPLQRLLKCTPLISDVINTNDKTPKVDYAIPMLSLAGMLTPTMASIPARPCEFYLDVEHIDHWKEKVAELPRGVRIGICWAGMARDLHPGASAIDAIRSTTLASFAPLAAVPGILWVSLQKGKPAEQIKTPPRGMTIADMTEDMNDFYDTCCAMAACDLIISVDTAVVHAAASIGKPTWLLSRWDGCWRWFGDREDSPWYPSLRQFVQPKPHDWEGLMQKVRIELIKFVSNKMQPELDLTLAS